MIRIIAIICLGACALPHVDPLPRTSAQATATMVELHVDCSDSDPFATSEPGRSITDNPLRWGGNVSAGVIISERHVLTSAHVGYCGPTIPTVIAILPNERQRMLIVTRDGLRHDEPISRLEIRSGSRFDLGIAPPLLGHARVGDQVTMYTLYGARSGTAIHDALSSAPDSRPTEIDGVHQRYGDVGSPVYSGDMLIGIVDAGEEGANVTYTPSDPSWLEGT